MTESKNYAKAKAYCDKHPNAFNIVKKEDHSIFKKLTVKELDELIVYLKSKIPDIEELNSKYSSGQQIKDLAMVKKKAKALKDVRIQTPEICLEAVRKDGDTLKYVLNQNPILCIEAVNQYGPALRFVATQTSEICMAAVKQDGRSLRYVINKTKEICEEAIKTSGWDEVNKYISIENRFEFKIKESDFK